MDHLRPNYLEGAQPHLSADNWVEDLWSMTLPSRPRPSFPHRQSITSEASTSLSSSSIRGQTEWKPQKQKISQNWSAGSQPCVTQWNYEPLHTGPHKMDRSWWRVLTKRGPLKKAIANNFSILASRTPWTVWKGKKIWHWKMSPSGW